MEPQGSPQFKEIMALIREANARSIEMERYWNERHQQAMARMDRADERMGRMEREHKAAIARQEKFERGVRKLIIIGAKEMIRNRQETRELKRALNAFLHARGSGANGRGRN